MPDLRRSLDALLAAKPGVMVERYDAQNTKVMMLAKDYSFETQRGPWVCVDFADGERFAIWKHTGDVFRLDALGAAASDAVIEYEALPRPV